MIKAVFILHNHDWKIFIIGEKLLTGTNMVRWFVIYGGHFVWQHYVFCAIENILY